MPERGLLDLRLQEILRYKFLLWLLVRRDFVSTYKQTVLGPIWIVLQPLLTTLVFTVVFGNLAGLSTDGQPKLLFYLAGVTCWGLFSTSLMRTSGTFIANADLFGKVYFPRLIVPLAIVASSGVRFAIQFFLFLCVLALMYLGGVGSAPGGDVLLLPVLVALLSAIALGIGLMISAVTAKYRDLQLLLQFGVQLFMYATPVIYPLSAMPDEYRVLLSLNPVTPLIEAFRAIFLTDEPVAYAWLGYSAACATCALVGGLLAFNRAEQRFMDTV